VFCVHAGENRMSPAPLWTHLWTQNVRLPQNLCEHYRLLSICRQDIYHVFFGRQRNCLDVGLLADAELAEYKVQNVIARRGASESIEGTECFVEIEENHFVGNGRYNSLLCLDES
jgi:hypothetical protein